MVFESPAAVRLVVSRKHSPWTMERDRKKSKAHLGSPEPLSEEIEEEAEDEEPDDHDMTEQEAQVLACLGQLNVGSSLANQGEDADGAALSRAGSLPDGQRRKLRGSRALSASYHNRLRSCLLNDKGSPLPHSSKSYTGGAAVGQENTAPVMFGPVMFGEQSKCWVGRRPSPHPQDAPFGLPAYPLGASGVTHPSSTFATHGPAKSTAEDQSLLTLTNSSRADKLTPSESPAPKGRSHRRSLSGASIAAACGLNDSAEALHGPSEHCPVQEGRGPKPVGGLPHARSVSEGSAAHRHVGVGLTDALRPGAVGCDDPKLFVSGLTATPSPKGSSAGDAGDCDASKAANQTSRALAAAPRSPSSASAASPAPTTSPAFVSKYGIAAFGVPASVQSCFADPTGSASAQPWHGTAAAAGSLVTGPPSEPIQETGVRSASVSACHGSGNGNLLRPASTSSGDHRWHAVPSGTAGTGVAAASLGSGPLLGFGTAPLVETSSGPLLGGGHARLTGPSFGAHGTGKALADSAEELELRRLAHQAPDSWPALRHEWSLPGSGQLLGQPQASQQAQPPTSSDSFEIPRPAETGSGAAAWNTVAGAVSEPLPGGPANASAFGSAAFDLVSLARSAGAFLGSSSGFSCFSTSGHFSTDAVQGAIGGPPVPSSSSCRWSAAPRGDTCSHQGVGPLINLDDSNNNDNRRNDADNSNNTKTRDNTSCNTDDKVNTHAKDNRSAFASCFANATPLGIGPPERRDGRDATEGGATERQPQQPPPQHDCPGQFHTPLELSRAAVGAGSGDVRAEEDQGDRGLDGEDSSSWLRTSQQAPDPDDPSSAGKYSAVLLRRLQAAAEHEELFGAASTGGGHSDGAYGFYHLQGSCGSGLSNGELGLRSSSGRLHLGSHGSSSVEPSPLPRLSSRLRRLRASPCLGGSGGSLTSPAPSSALLGTRSRSAGVTPGGATCRRLRRRSDLLMADQRGGGSGRADVDELDDSDAGADEHMHDAGGHGMLGLAGSDGQLLLLAGQRGGPGSLHLHQHDVQDHRQRGTALPLRHSQNGAGHDAAGGAHLRASPPLRAASMFAQAGAGVTAAGFGDGPELVARAKSAAAELLAPQHPPRPQARGCDDFLSGLMDYEDDGVEYMTPPHTPLRGIGAAAHEHDAATAPRAGQANFIFSGGRMAPNGNAAAGHQEAWAIAPGRGRQGFGKGALQQRVTFAAHRLAGGGGGGCVDTPPTSPPGMAGSGGGRDESACAQMLLTQSLSTTQEFNRCLATVATSNDRGSAERLWQEMCSRGVTPDINTLNSLLRCLSRSAADPEEAHLLVRDVCSRGGFSANGTSQRLLEEICFRFEQLHGGQA